MIKYIVKLPSQRHAAAELDHAVITDMDAVVVVASWEACDPLEHVEMISGLESACHAHKVTGR